MCSPVPLVHFPCVPIRSLEGPVQLSNHNRKAYQISAKAVKPYTGQKARLSDEKESTSVKDINPNEALHGAHTQLDQRGTVRRERD